jgi:hypothetical protein
VIVHSSLAPDLPRHAVCRADEPTLLNSGMQCVALNSSYLNWYISKQHVPAVSSGIVVAGHRRIIYEKFPVPQFLCRACLGVLIPARDRLRCLIDYVDEVPHL